MSLYEAIAIHSRGVHGKNVIPVRQVGGVDLIRPAHICAAILTTRRTRVDAADVVAARAVSCGALRYTINRHLDGAYSSDVVQGPTVKIRDALKVTALTARVVDADNRRVRALVVGCSESLGAR